MVVSLRVGDMFVQSTQIDMFWYCAEPGLQRPDDFSIGCQSSKHRKHTKVKQGLLRSMGSHRLQRPHFARLANVALCTQSSHHLVETRAADLGVVQGAGAQVQRGVGAWLCGRRAWLAAVSRRFDRIQR
eukprot:362040-Chlamydomonas_euryale.AAC.3